MRQITIAVNIPRDDALLSRFITNTQFGLNKVQQFDVRFCIGTVYGKLRIIGLRTGVGIIFLNENPVSRDPLRIAPIDVEVGNQIVRTFLANREGQAAGGEIAEISPKGGARRVYVAAPGR